MELTDRYFDQDLTAAELEKFEQQLLNDKDAALAFARAARLDYALEANVCDAAKESDLSQLIALLKTGARSRKTDTPSEATERIRKRLSRYYLPQTDIEDLPLDEALGVLQATFYSVHQLGWGDIEAIAFKKADEEGNTPKVSLNRNNRSALSALNLLAIQSGHELSFAPSEILFKKKQDDKIEGDDGAGCGVFPVIFWQNKYSFQFCPKPIWRGIIV